MLDFHFVFRGGEVEIATTYTHLLVQFTSPRFKMRPTFHPCPNKGMPFFLCLSTSVSSCIFKTFQQRCIFSIPPSNPPFFIVLKYEGLVWSERIGCVWRESNTLCYSVWYVVNRLPCMPLFKPSFAPIICASRAFSRLFFPFTWFTPWENPLLDKRYPYLALFSLERLPR